MVGKFWTFCFVCRSFDTLEHVADGKGLSMRHDATWLHNTFSHFKSFRRAALDIGLETANTGSFVISYTKYS